MVDKNVILELEKVIFGVLREGRAASFMADLVGVLIGVKPTMSEFFSEKEFAKLDPQDFLELMKKLGLKCIVSYHFSYSCGRFEPSINFSIAKDYKKATQIKEAFELLWDSMDEFGQVINKRQWKNATKKIGKSLGYPATAVKDFLNDEDVDNPDRQARMARNRYYAHSAKHEREEFLSYDRPINLAVEKYAKRSAEILRADGGERWTEF